MIYPWKYVIHCIPFLIYCTLPVIDKYFYHIGECLSLNSWVNKEDYCILVIMFSFLLLNFPIKAKRLDKSQPNLVLSSGFSKNLVFRERDRGREKGRERERERQTDRQTDRQTGRDKHTDRQRERVKICFCMIIS